MSSVHLACVVRRNNVFSAILGIVTERETNHGFLSSCAFLLGHKHFVVSQKLTFVSIPSKIGLDTTWTETTSGAAIKANSWL